MLRHGSLVAINMTIKVGKDNILISKPIPILYYCNDKENIEDSIAQNAIVKEFVNSNIVDSSTYSNASLNYISFDLDSEDEDWKDIATTWANINPISGKEYYSAETINSDLTHKIRLRYRKGITPDMRVIYNDRIFYIISVINEYEKNTMLQLMCRELI